MLYLRRFTRLLFVLLFALLLGISVNTVHSRPAFAATCDGASWQSLNSDTKIQSVSNGTTTYKITVHTILEEQIGNQGFCGRLHAVTQVTLSECHSATICQDEGTATAFVAANGTRFTNSSDITLSVPPGQGNFSMKSVTSPPVLVSCGAAGGTYVGAQGHSGGENISSGSAQKCG